MTWKERCDRAAERGGFTDEDEDLATHWTTCAVSEHQLTEYEVKHRHAWQSTPDNLLLQQLGIQFLDAVRHNHPFHALKLIEKIASAVADMRAVETTS